MGYVVLGFLLGSVPIIVGLFGIPLEVRHVTLAAASLGYALDARWIEGTLSRWDILFSFTGILLVGICNITSSFALSFLLAIRARDIGQAKSRMFLKEVVGQLVAHPVAFLIPQSDRASSIESTSA